MAHGPQDCILVDTFVFRCDAGRDRRVVNDCFGRWLKSERSDVAITVVWGTAVTRTGTRPRDISDGFVLERELWHVTPLGTDIHVLQTSPAARRRVGPGLQHIACFVLFVFLYCCAWRRNVWSWSDRSRGNNMYLDGHLGRQSQL